MDKKTSNLGIFLLLILGGPLSRAAATIIIKPALKNHSPLVFNVSLFVNINPPLTAIFSYLFFGIGISFYFLLAARSCWLASL